MNTEILSGFLQKAKRQTYALEGAPKAPASRLGSKDYEWSEGSLTYHDTYFGSVFFIGEEVVYENGVPQWGMNYNGYVVDPDVTEAEIDKSLRAALKQDWVDIIPVRGPKTFSVDNYTYTNDVRGTLERFDGREEVHKDGVLIYYALFHGGSIA